MDSVRHPVSPLTDACWYTTQHKKERSRNYGNLSSHIGMHTHAGSRIHNPVTLTFDLSNSGSMHAELLR